jgi:predicted small lipoprotein YifL
LLRAALLARSSPIPAAAFAVNDIFILNKPAAMFRASAILAVLFIALALQACGTKGPLYLPVPGAPAPGDNKQPGSR